MLWNNLEVPSSDTFQWKVISRRGSGIYDVCHVLSCHLRIHPRHCTLNTSLRGSLLDQMTNSPTPPDYISLDPARDGASRVGHVSAWCLVICGHVTREIGGDMQLCTRCPVCRPSSSSSLLLLSLLLLVCSVLFDCLYPAPTILLLLHSKVAHHGHLRLIE